MDLDEGVDPLFPHFSFEFFPEPIYRALPIKLPVSVLKRIEENPELNISIQFGSDQVSCLFSVVYVYPS
jgi:hypothetical protein